MFSCYRVRVGSSGVHVTFSANCQYVHHAESWNSNIDFGGFGGDHVAVGLPREQSETGESSRAVRQGAAASVFGIYKLKLKLSSHL